MLNTAEKLFPGSFPPLRRGRVTTLQVNLGYLCNQQCQHCHVNAGPNRSEVMDGETLQLINDVVIRGGIETLDLTGGAPEMNPGFRKLVTAAAETGVHVIDRCNLTILLEPDQLDLAEFLAEHRVEVVASLPCYLKENVDGQRGHGVFDKSIEGLRRLNALGYGEPDSGLLLNLVYNPVGPYLPPSQCELETDYRKRLGDYGIRFSHLLALANMPIQRFGSMLQSKGQFDTYLGLLKGAHRGENLASVMCRNLVSVDWQGYLYDCDFNQMLQLPLGAQPRRHLSDLDLVTLDGEWIAVADHCYGCTAGQGSSCGGALSG